MFVPTTGLTLSLRCKDCHRPVSDSENNGYRLISGVLYGWCNDCFKNGDRGFKRGATHVRTVDPAAGDESKSESQPEDAAG